jgi:hypothetical protein
VEAPGGVVTLAVVAGLVGLVGLVGIFGLLLAPRHRRRSTRRRAQAAAAARGLRYLADAQAPPSIPFRRLSIGRSRRAEHIMWADADEHEASVFDYRFTVGSGQQARTHRFGCAVFRTGLAAPHLVLDRQNVGRQLLGRFGPGAIRTESPAFNETWHVTCDDARFAVTVLDPAMIDWLVGVAAGRSIEIELLGDRGLVICPRTNVEELPALLDIAHRFARELPRVAHELYPWPR